MTRTRSRHSARSRLVWTALAIAFCLVTAGSSALDGPSTAIADDPFTPQDLAASILDALGVNPEYEVRDAFGRSVPLSTGQVRRVLFEG